MYVRRLQLTSFRNYRSLDLELAPGHLLFLGDNAQGKSNLLEAAYLLASGKSSRAGQDAELIGWGAESEGQPFGRAQATLRRGEGEVALETLVVGPAQPPAPPSRGGKRYKVNGIARRAVDFVGLLRAVLFTADDLDIVSGPPANRRAYLDGPLSQIDRAYYAALRRYGRLMQQRNATLRRIKEGIAGVEELALWDEGFSHEGATIIAGRRDAARRLAELASAAQASLSGAALESLELAYEPQLGEEWRAAWQALPPDASLEAVQQLLAAALAGQRRRETGAGVSLVGPHRDELAIRLNGADAAAFGSRAQIRTAALALRLAEAELLRGVAGDPPVLLLDDILSEMDERRRASVLAGLSGFEQVWFTATTGTGLPPEFLAGCQQYLVEDGEVRGV